MLVATAVPGDQFIPFSSDYHLTRPGSVHNCPAKAGLDNFRELTVQLPFTYKTNKKKYETDIEIKTRRLQSPLVGLRASHFRKVPGSNEL